MVWLPERSRYGVPIVTSRWQGCPGLVGKQTSLREAYLRRLTLAPALLAATFVLTAPANAQVMERGTVSSAQRSDTADYWTAERMQNAEPAVRTINADGSVAKAAAAPLPWTSQEVTTPYTN